MAGCTKSNSTDGGFSFIRLLTKFGSIPKAAATLPNAFPRSRPRCVHYPLKTSSSMAKSSPAMRTASRTELLHGAHPSHRFVWIFDLLALAGDDLRTLPLFERKVR